MSDPRAAGRLAAVRAQVAALEAGGRAERGRLPFGAAEVDAAFLESPAYTAVREWLPAGRPAATFRVAEPEESVAVPSDVVPAKNSTFPVAAAGATVAVRSNATFSAGAVAGTESVVVLAVLAASTSV